MSWNDRVITEFREGRERVADTFDREALLLLHTVGARSGEPRESPLAFFRDGDRILIVASAAGAERHPAWYHNLLATPTAQVEVWDGDRMDRIDVDAEPLPSDERDRAWAMITERAPGFAEYQRKTDRVIPVVGLRPRRD
jgi:deazaflavin-dependent oxidoreductase (nitroreductase family)